MAQFRAEIRGQRGSASRLGNKKTGLVGVVCGWNGGVRVEAYYSASGKDCFNVYSTKGSNGGNFGGEFLGHVDEYGKWHAAIQQSEASSAMSHTHTQRAALAAQLRRKGLHQ